MADFDGNAIGFTDRDLDIAARTMLGEARNQGPLGMEAVAHVLGNRAYSNFDDLGRSIAAQALAATPRGAYQFSAWNPTDPNRAYIQGLSVDNPLYQSALQIARDVFSGRRADPTKGATAYRVTDYPSAWHSTLERMGAVPLGDHTFSRMTAQSRATPYSAEEYGMYNTPREMADYSQRAALDSILGGQWGGYNSPASGLASFAGVPTEYGGYSFGPMNDIGLEAPDEPGGLFGFEDFDPNWGGIPQADLPGSLYGLAPDNLGVPMAAEPGALYGLEGPQPTYGMPTDWGVGMNFGSPTFDMSYTPQQSPQMNMGVPDVPAPLNVGDFGGSNIDWGGLLQGATLGDWNPDFSTYAEDLGIGDIEAPGALVGLDPQSISMGYAPGVGASRATSVMDMPSTIFGSAWAGAPEVATLAAAAPSIAGVNPSSVAPASRTQTPAQNTPRAPLNYAPVQDIPQQAPPMEITPQFAGVPTGFDPSWGVTGLAPAVMDQLGAAGVGAPTGGYSYGYSPLGDYSMVHAGAPEYAQIAASGPGLFGAFGSLFSGQPSAQPSGDNGGLDYSGPFGSQFGGGWSSDSLNDSYQGGDYGGGGGYGGGDDSSGGYGGGDYGGGADPAGNNGN